MSLRYSPEDAVRLGLISKAEGDVITSAMRKSPKRSSGSSRAVKVVDPQTILFHALCRRLPGQPEAEKEGLIPGRKFRADIFINPCFVIEMDGFQYHRQKAAFQKDRERENLMAAHGFRIFRTFAKEVLDPESLARLVELIAKSVENKAFHSPTHLTTSAE